MKTNGHRGAAGAGTARTGGGPPVGGTMLVVDPEDLTRWAIASYFSRVFTVIPVATAERARAELDTHPVDAMIISNDLTCGPRPCEGPMGRGLASPAGDDPQPAERPPPVPDAVGADSVERYARQRNPYVLVVRTTTDAGEANRGHTRAVLVEKPFRLASLARMLGTQVPPS